MAEVQPISLLQIDNALELGQGASLFDPRFQDDCEAIPTLTKLTADGIRLRDILYGYRRISNLIPQGGDRITAYCQLDRQLRPLYCLTKFIKSATEEIAEQMKKIASRPKHAWSCASLEALILCIDATLSLDMTVTFREDACDDVLALREILQTMPRKDLQVLDLDQSSVDSVLGPLCELLQGPHSQESGSWKPLKIPVHGALSKLLVNHMKSVQIHDACTLLLAFIGSRLSVTQKQNQLPCLSAASFFGHLRAAYWLIVLFGAVTPSLQLSPHALPYAINIVNSLPLSPFIGTLVLTPHFLIESLGNPSLSSALMSKLHLADNSPAACIVRAQQDLLLLPVMPLIRIQHTHILAALSAALATEAANMPSSGTELYQALVRALACLSSWQRRILFSFAVRIVIGPENMATLLQESLTVMDSAMAEAVIMLRDVATVLTTNVAIFNRGVRAHIAASLETIATGELFHYANGTFKDPEIQKIAKRILELLPDPSLLPPDHISRSVQRRIMKGVPLRAALHEPVEELRSEQLKAAWQCSVTPGVPAASEEQPFVGWDEVGRFEAISGLFDQLGCLTSLSFPLSCAAVIAFSRKHGSTSKNSHILLAQHGSHEAQAVGGTWITAVQREICLWRQLRNLQDIVRQVCCLSDLSISTNRDGFDLVGSLMEALFEEGIHSADGALSLFDIFTEAAYFAVRRARSPVMLCEIERMSEISLHTIVVHTGSAVWKYAIHRASVILARNSAYFGRVLPPIADPVPPPHLQLASRLMIPVAGRRVNFATVVARQVHYLAARDTVELFHRMLDVGRLQTLPEFDLCLAIISLAATEIINDIIPGSAADMKALVDALDGRNQGGRFTSQVLTVIYRRLLIDLGYLGQCDSNSARISASPPDARQPRAESQIEKILRDLAEIQQSGLSETITQLRQSMYDAESYVKDASPEEASQMRQQIRLHQAQLASDTPAPVCQQRVGTHLDFGTAGPAFAVFFAETSSYIGSLHTASMRRLFAIGDEMPPVSTDGETAKDVSFAIQIRSRRNSLNQVDLGSFQRRRTSTTQLILNAQAQALGVASQQTAAHKPIVFPGLLVFVDRLADAAALLTEKCVVPNLMLIKETTGDARYHLPDLLAGTESALNLAAMLRQRLTVAGDQTIETITSSLRTIGVIYTLVMSLREAAIAASVDPGAAQPDLLYRFLCNYAAQCRGAEWYRQEIEYASVAAADAESVAGFGRHRIASAVNTFIAGVATTPELRTLMSTALDAVASAFALIVGVVRQTELLRAESLPFFVFNASTHGLQPQPKKVGELTGKALRSAAADSETHHKSDMACWDFMVEFVESFSDRVHFIDNAFA